MEEQRVEAAGPAVTTWHLGAHDRFGQAYARLAAWRTENDREAAGPAWEVYHWVDLAVTGEPGPSPDPSTWRVQLVQPINQDRPGRFNGRADSGAAARGASTPRAGNGDRIGGSIVERRGNRPMQHTRLGTSGLKVSRIALGCMSFGDASRGYNDWALDDQAAEPIFRQAVELGITFWDTANAYGHGTSEEIVGRAIRKCTDRDAIVLATKVFFKMHDGPGGSGLSRKAIMEQVDASLSRLGTDYVDLYQIHRFDPDTPVEETMEALHDVVKSGKARYIGASSMWAWQFAKLQHAADLGGWTRFMSMQNQYSLLQREEEREMFGLLADQGVGSIPWSPLAKGRLARPWSENTTRRAGSDPLQSRYVGEENEPIVAAVQQVAEARGVPMAQVALAWVLHHPVVAAPIVGPTKPHHLADAVAALDLKLTDDEVEALEAHYTPRLPSGYE
jgi:aryl-alcohol dehydrogenase-like predicted oxidoreductase